MTPTILMIVSGVVLLISGAVCIWNMIHAFDDDDKEFSEIARIHFFSGALAALGGWALVAGFVWFLVERLAG